MALIRISEVKNLRFGPGVRVECWSRHRWCPGTIVAMHYRDPDWEAGCCAAYQVRLDNGFLIFSPSDSPICIRASGEVARPHLVLPGLDDGTGPYQLPLGFFYPDWGPTRRAHRLVEILCTPANTMLISCWGIEMRNVADSLTGLRGSFDRLHANIGPAATQALIGWSALSVLFTRDDVGAACLALLRCPQTLSMLCQWLAHTPNLGAMEKSCPAYDPAKPPTLVETRMFNYTGERGLFFLSCSACDPVKPPTLVEQPHTRGGGGLSSFLFLPFHLWTPHGHTLQPQPTWCGIPLLLCRKEPPVFHQAGAVEFHPHTSKRHTQSPAVVRMRQPPPPPCGT